MTREEREAFVGLAVMEWTIATGEKTRDEVVEAIVNKWEEDVQDNRDERYGEGLADGQEAMEADYVAFVENNWTPGNYQV